jgi:hypothetical protein
MSRRSTVRGSAFLLSLLLALLLALPIPAQEVCGHHEVIGGQHVLFIWGTHAQRGYAHGYLLGAEAKTLFDDYFVDDCCGGSAAYYAYVRNLYVTEYAVDTKYQVEAEAFIDGARDAGVDMYNTSLGRDMDTIDILVVNAIVDISQRIWKGKLGCSSLSSWGSSTAGDPTLAGHLMITRHLDWDKHPALTASAALIVQIPAEPDEQRWLSVGFAGFMGALSAINSSGLGAFYNVGNVAICSGGAPYQPVNYSLRSGVEAADYDGSGSCTAADIAAAIGARTRSSASIVHVAQDAGPSSWPVIVECNNPLGVALRDPAQNTVVPGEHLVATNHFRTLYSPVYCHRYAGIVDSLTINTAVTRERSWTLMAGAAGQYATNLQAVQYLPSADLLYWATDTASQPAYLQEPRVFDVSDLLYHLTGVPEATAPLRLAQNEPNPFNPLTVIPFALTAEGHCRLTIYDLRGRAVRTLLDARLERGPHQVAWDGCDAAGHPVPTSAYVYRLESAEAVASRKMLLVR